MNSSKVLKIQFAAKKQTLINLNPHKHQMFFKRFHISTVVAAIAFAFPIAALADSSCPEPPPGMKYEMVTASVIHEISLNHKPFVICTTKIVGDSLGADYYKYVYSCPTFSVTKKDGGLVGALRSINNRFMPKFYEQWDVTDKNNNKFNIYYGLSDQEKTFKPKTETIRNSIPQGCQETRITEIRSSKASLGLDPTQTITLTIRTTNIEVLKKIPTLTF